MKVLSLLLLLIAFAAGIGVGVIKNGFAAVEKDPQSIQISVVSGEEAERLFNKFAGDKSIPFKFPLDGCYARATEMAKIAEKEDVVMGKVYASGLLQVKTDSAKYPIVRWGWHVAPVAFVRQKDGSDKLMVFDPSLFKKPVTEEEWTNKMMAEVNGVKSYVDEAYFGSRYQYYPKSHEGTKEKWDNGDLVNVKEIFEKYRPLEDRGAPVENGKARNKVFDVKRFFNWGKSPAGKGAQ